MLMVMFLLNILILLSFNLARVQGVQQHTSVTGFTAWPQETIVYQEDTLLVFDGCNINEGGFYQASSGRFICPTDGVYFVSVNIRRTNAISQVKVVKNTTDVILLVSDTSGQNIYNIQSNSALIDCNTLETIELKGDVTNGQVYGEMGIPTSTFTVFLVSSAQDAKEHNDFYGFSAYLDTTYLDYTASEILAFEGVILPSPDYNETSGEYTCPVTGMYFVNTNFRKYSDNPMNVGPALDFVFLLHSNDVYQIDNHYNQHGNSRFFFCSEGQIISVRGFAAGYINGHTTDVLSTVSVMLVQKTEQINEHPVFIGFSAYNIEHQEYAKGDVIRFDGILVNEGDYFDGQHFQCPIYGIYFLSVNFKKTLNYNIYLDVKQGNVLLFRSEETNINNQLNTVSISGLFQCVANQAVSVEAYDSGWVHGDPLKYFTTFSIMYMGPKE